MHASGHLRAGSVQAQAQRLRLGPQGFQRCDVLEHIARVDVLLVRHRESATVALRGRQPGGLSLALNQHLTQAVCPRRRGLSDALLDRGQIGLAAILRIGAHDDMHARMNGAGDLHLRFDARAPESIEDDLLDPLPYLGAVTISRHVDEAGIEPMEWIAASQQAHGAPLIQIDDPTHDTDEVVHVCLE